MDEINNLFQGFAVALSFQNLGFMLIGILLGVLIGFYVSSVLFISSFMVWQGKYSPLKSGLVGLCVSGVLFLLFDVWFLLPLPKGPLETFFGY